jgi:hypothetical protein
MEYKIGMKVYLNKRVFKEVFGLGAVEFSNPKYNFTIVRFDIRRGLFYLRSNFNGKITAFTEAEKGKEWVSNKEEMGVYYNLVSDQLELDFGGGK